jgi:peptidyl-dipeptidase Dcp
MRLPPLVLASLGIIAMDAGVAAPPPAHPLVAAWVGPFGGVPPFDRVMPADLGPALDAACAAELAAVQRIVDDPEPPTFANTILALDRAGRTLERVSSVYSVFTGNLSDDAVQAVEREMAPRLAAHGDRIVHDAALFARVKAVYDARETSGLTPEQQRLCWLTFTSFVRRGAALDPDAKRELADVNARLATLATTFSQHVLADETDRHVLVDDAGRLAGLSAPLVAAAAAAARDRGHAGAWSLANTRSVVEPVLTFARDRGLREEVWRMFVTRGDDGGPHDTGAVVRDIVRLRARRAGLLGYPTHAHWRLEHSMARTPERAIALLEEVWGPAVATVRREVAAMQAMADAEGAGVTIEPWDYRFYAEQVRQATYDLDEAEVVPYLQLERLREGMFHVAARLFDLHFTPVAAGSVPVFHPDVRVWEVRRGDGRHVGLWYFDPFARPGKRSGAWMSGYRPQSRSDGEVPAIVSNNCNFTKGPPEGPVTISWEDATTLFHEFGHALHGLSSSVTYPALSGTRVARDYVEFPSQILEHWLATPEILDGFTRHVETGAPLPAALAAKIERAARFNQGFRTVEFLASALVDMRLHLAAPPDDPAAFERDALTAIGMPREIVMRHRLPHFSHLFAGDGYSAAYYSYLWADVLTADAWEAFTEAGGPWDEAVAGRLRRHVFSTGNTIEPADGYRAFRGRDPATAALMRKRGFE